MYRRIISLIDQLKEASDDQVSTAKKIIFNIYQSIPNYIELYKCCIKQDEDGLIIFLELINGQKYIIVEVFKDGRFDAWCHDEVYIVNPTFYPNDIEWIIFQLLDLPEELK